MVLIWNDLSCGDREAAAVLVAINSVFQIVAFGALGWFYLQVLPGWLGLSTTDAGLLRRRDRRCRCWSSSASRWSPASSPARSASGPRAATGTRAGSCRGSARSRSTGCCSRSSCCSRCRATPSPPSPLRRRPHRAAAAGLLRAHVRRRRSCSARGSRLGYAEDRDAGVHRRRQQLRARHRRRHRHLRRHLRPGAGRRRRPAHRGARPRRPRLRRPLAAALVPPAPPPEDRRDDRP